MTKLEQALKYILKQYDNHRRKNNENQSSSPLVVGLQGIQGVGKTTLCSQIVNELLNRYKIRCVTISIDDFYKTRDELKRLYLENHQSWIWKSRGLPGTHNIQLAVETMEQLLELNKTKSTAVTLPKYDKNAYGGEGDQISNQILLTRINSPLDIVILEGWCLGFCSVGLEFIQNLLIKQKKQFCKSLTLDELFQMDSYLKELETKLYKFMDALIILNAPDWRMAYKWRWEQEICRGGKMSESDCKEFVDRFSVCYEIYLPCFQNYIERRFPHISVYELELDKERQLI